MQYFNNTLAVEANMLIKNNIVGWENLKKMVLRGNVTKLRRASKERPMLLAYDSLPARVRAEVKALVPDPHAAAAGNDIEALIEHDAGLSAAFLNYRDESGYLKPGRQRELYANCIVLEAVGRYIEKCTSKRSALGNRRPIPAPSWEAISEAVRNVDRSQYPHSLPGNAKRLREKFRRYGAGGWQIFVHKNRCNRHAARVESEDSQSVMIRLISDGRNLDNEQIARLYNMVAAREEWKPVTAGTVRTWRRRYDLETYAGRRGVDAFMNGKAMQIKRRAPEFPLSFWTLDGWDAELLYRHTDEKGVTSYHHRPTVVMVMDTCLMYPVGYAIGTHETPALIRAALQNAARHTAELFGTMYRTQQIQSDRYAIGKMMPFYEGMGKYVTPARKHNAKAKRIEPYFNRFNRKYCQMMTNWSGFGITSNRDSQPSKDAIDHYKKTFPDYAGVCAQVEKMIGLERAGKVGRYRELFALMPAERRLELPEDNYLLLFGETTGRRNMLTGSGVHATIMGQMRYYDCFDVSFRRHPFVKWELHYDPADLSRVLAVNEDGTLRYMLEKKHVQPEALVERAAGDSDHKARVEHYNQEVFDYVSDFQTNVNARVRALVTPPDGVARRESDWGALPGAEDTLFKIPLTDSRGQHKDNRNRARLRDAEVTDIDVEDRAGIWERY
jgi:hypothetical protein